MEKPEDTAEKRNTVAVHVDSTSSFYCDPCILCRLSLFEGQDALHSTTEHTADSAGIPQHNDSKLTKTYR